MPDKVKANAPQAAPQGAKEGAATEPDSASEPDDSEEFRQLPTLDEKPLPSLERLLKGPALDWIVLARRNKVIEVEPVQPRPDTLAKVEQRVRQAMATPLPKSDGTNNAARDEERQRRQDLNKLEVVLLKNDKDDGEYRIHIQSVRQIIHYEELMLRRTDQLLNEERTADAFELLAALAERDARWPGIGERQVRLKFVESQVRARHEEWESALGLLEQIHHQSPGYPNLEKELSTVSDRLIEQSVAQGDFRRARHFLNRLKSSYPANAVTERWMSGLNQRASQQAEQARAAAQEGQFPRALDLAELATRIWPENPASGEAYRDIFPRYQRLTVGTLDLAVGPSAPPGAVARERLLLQADLFEPARLDDRLMRYQTRFVQDWEPTELGRSIRFRLKRQTPAWDGQEQVTAGPLLAEIVSRLTPTHPEFDERFANYVAGVRSLSPFELQVDFARAPIRPEVLFQFPVARSTSSPPVSPTSPESRVPPTSPEQPSAPTPPMAPVSPALSASSDLPNTPVTARQRMVRTSADDQRIHYRRALSQPSNLRDQFLTELIEQRYQSSVELWQGWRRGEISLVPDVPLWDLDEAARLPEVSIVELALPATHLIQFHPRNTALRNSSLRRALVYGIDRQQVLEQVVLRGAATARGKLVSSPVSSRHAAYNPLIEPHPCDVRLAHAMLLAARKDLDGTIPAFKLGVSANLLEKAAASELARQWKLLGLEITVVEVGPQIPLNLDQDPLPFDMLYRVVALSEPLTDLWPCLTLDTQARVSALLTLPDWLRKELIALEEAGDWGSAERLLKKIHRDLWSEVHLIPLWEVPRFMLARKHFRGIPARPIHPYQDIERWQVQPWFLKDTP